MSLRFLTIGTLALVGVACFEEGAPEPRSGYFGTIKADGRDVGQSTWNKSGELSGNPGYLSYDDGECHHDDLGRVVVRVPTSVRVGGPGGYAYGEITLPESSADGVDVKFPWSHVALSRAQCSKLDVEPNVSVPDRATDGGTVRGIGVHLSCQLPDRSDMLDVDVTVVNCR